MSLDLDEGSRQPPSDEESDDDVICLGSDDDEEETGAVGGFKQPDLSSVGLSQLQAPLLTKSPRTSVKKMQWNRYGATLGPLVGLLAVLVLISLVRSSFP